MLVAALGWMANDFHGTLKRFHQYQSRASSRKRVFTGNIFPGVEGSRIADDKHEKEGHVSSELVAPKILLNRFPIQNVQGGPLPVVWRIVTPHIGVITPVTD